MKSTSRTFGQLLHIVRRSEHGIGTKSLSNAEMSVLIAIVDCVDRYGVDPTLKQIKNSLLQNNIPESVLKKSLITLVSNGLVCENSLENPPTYSM